MNFAVFIPELILILTACVVVFGEWFFKPVDKIKEKRGRNIGLAALVGLCLSFGSLVGFKSVGFGITEGFFASDKATFHQSFLLDDFAVYFKMIIVLSSILTVLISFRYVSEKIRNSGEFYSLICMATLGGMFLSSANEMITFFLGVELLSISSYVLTCMNKDNPKSSESALKYFVVGGLSSALTLYGFSIMFGLTGAIDFPTVAAGLSKYSQPLNVILVIATVMSFSGLAYKIAAAPFHMWAPDVYEGAPTPVTAFLSITSKIAGFAAFARFIQIFTNELANQLLTLVVIVSIITMCAGNFLAIIQKNVKRMFAFSSIAHAGYILIGIIPLMKGNYDDFTSVLFYLTTYIFMNIGAFGAIMYFSKHTGSTDIDSFAGVAKKSPFIAFVFSCCLVSLAGLPPFGGFTGKLYLFVSAFNSGYAWLAFIGALNSVVSLYYYVKVMKAMYLREPEESITWEAPNAALAMAAIISLLGLLVLFLAPAPFLQMAKIGF
ncbi:MAG: NADH-quinone oxidoreductase subunit N [Candidatus Sericytochromatia bacterium]